MTKDLILKKIEKNVRALFMDETIVVTMEMVSSDVEGWDSFEHVNLLINLEEEFNIKFNINDVIKINNVGELVELIKRQVDIVVGG